MKIEDTRLYQMMTPEILEGEETSRLKFGVVGIAFSKQFAVNTLVPASAVFAAEQHIIDKAKKAVIEMLVDTVTHYQQELTHDG
jgi:hypothetical protein